MLTQALPDNVLKVLFTGLDKKSLKQCSLVCRSWALLACHHLFRELAFRTSRGHTDLWLFLECIQHSKRIAPSLHKLTLSGERTPNEPWTDSECSLVVLRQILLSLPHLQYMRIKDAMFYEPSRMAYLPLTTLRKLEFSHDDFGPSAGLASILRIFTKIGHLSIQNFRQLDLSDSDMYIDYVPPHLIQVETLSLPDFGHPQSRDLDQQSTALNILIESLYKVLDFNTLTSIHLESVSLQNAGIYSRLFGRCTALVQLVVDRIAGNLLAMPMFSLSLSACSNLRIIHLNLYITVADSPAQQRIAQNLSWQFVCNMISSLPDNNNVQRLQLDVTLNRIETMVGNPDLGSIYNYLGQLNWAQFDEGLRSLRHLKVVWIKLNEYTQGCEAFVYLMTGLSKGVRKLVHVERRLSFAQWGSAYEIENLQSWAVDSCHRVRHFTGVTVLHVDPVARSQVVKLG